MLSNVLLQNLMSLTEISWTKFPKDGEEGHPAPELDLRKSWLYKNSYRTLKKKL